MNLEDVLLASKHEVSHSVDGRLSLLTRKKVLVALGTSGGSPDLEQTGFRRRVLLDALCVRHVMHVWSEHFPGHDGPEVMLSTAFSVANEAMSLDRAQRLRDSFYVDAIDGRDYSVDQAPAMFVAHAAANTVVTAMVRNIEDSLPEESDDEDLDPESYLPSHLCASACAGGLNGDHAARVEDRRSFWMWYLDEAVPAVMSSEI